MAEDAPRYAWSGPLVATSLRDQARRTLRARIVTGELKPGQLYAIGQIAEQLGVSSTPVREALLDLATEGAITIFRNRGFQVTPVTDTDLAEIRELRDMLEVPAIRAIAERHLIGDDSELRRQLEAMTAAADEEDWIGVILNDRSFHVTLLDFFGNRRLVQFVARLRAQSRYGLDLVGNAAEFLAWIDEDRALLEAVIAGDADGAEAIMASHVERTRGIWTGPPDPS